MKHSLLKAISILCLPLICILFTASASIGSPGTSTGYNIVFVVDASYSLNGHVVNSSTPPSDPNELRYQALGYMLALLPGTNSRAGLVHFNGNVSTFNSNLHLINSQDDVYDLYNYAVNQNLDYYTDITKAIDCAIHFFDDRRGKDENLPNLIMLFTDGKIELASGDVIGSRAKLETLAASAEAENIQVATVFLNKDNQYDDTDLRIITKNDDLFNNITSADDLTATFDSVHSLLFNAQKKDLSKGKDAFLVPRYGANMLTFTFFPESETDTFKLVSPTGVVRTNSDAIKMGDMYIMHIPTPEYGAWFSYISDGDGKVGTSVEDDLPWWQWLSNLWSQSALSGGIGMILLALVLWLLILFLKHCIKKINIKNKTSILSSMLISLLTFATFILDLFRGNALVSFFTNLFSLPI